jgi:NADH:ubiquinone oxidoreductase subunit E
MEQMCDTLTNNIRDIIQKRGPGREQLLPILNDVSIKFGHISENSLVEISKQMDLPIGEIHGVMSFYSYLNHKKLGKYVIRLCRTISCDMANKDLIIKSLQRELGISFGETTEDGKFSLEFTNCIGMCDRAPAMLINDKVYDSLNPEKIYEIIEMYKGGKI